MNLRISAFAVALALSFSTVELAQAADPILFRKIVENHSAERGSYSTWCEISRTKVIKTVMTPRAQAQREFKIQLESEKVHDQDILEDQVRQVFASKTEGAHPSSDVSGTYYKAFFPEFGAIGIFRFVETSGVVSYQYQSEETQNLVTFIDLICDKL